MIKLKDILSEDHMYKSSQTNVSKDIQKSDKNAGRIQFDNPGEGVKGFPPILNKIITLAAGILDKKINKGIKFFTMEYMLELTEDIIVSNVSKIQSNSNEFKTIQRIMILSLAKDYDIRKDGRRI